MSGKLERRGIGRPSTYASIISTIQDRGYVTLKKRRFHAEKIGELVTDRLVENFSDLLDYSFTADMEETLDQIASGDRDWLQVLDNFYTDFSRKLENAARPDGMQPNTPTMTGVDCPTCSRKMQVRSASTGVFLGCSGYALPPKKRCTKTMDLLPADEAADADRDDEAESRLLRAKRRCPTCSTNMDSYVIDAERKLHVCGKNPYCAGHEVEAGAFAALLPAARTIPCDKCSSEMELKSGRFGKFFGCMNAECRNTRKLLKNGEPAPPRVDPISMPELRCRSVDDHYVLRDGAAGNLPRRKPVPPVPRDARARGAGAEGARRRTRSEVPLPDRRAGDRSGGTAGGSALFAQDARAVPDVGGGRQGDRLARRLP